MSAPLSNLPLLNDDRLSSDIEAEKKIPRQTYPFSAKANWLPLVVQRSEQRSLSRWRRKTDVSIPLLVVLCVLLICSSVLLLSTSFASGSLLCKITSFCASAHNALDQAAVNLDPRPPLDESIAYSVRQSDGKTVDVTVTPALYTQPRCDPDADYSNHLMFATGFNGNAEIFVTNPSGTMICRVTNNLIFESSVDWSPDRQHILFIAQRDDNDINDVYAMNFDGSHIVDVSHDRFSEQRAMWSPDGTKIAFNYAINQQGRFSIMNADGSNRQKITPDSWNTYGASWSPDSTRIAFSYVIRSGLHEISAVDIKTHDLTTLASGRFEDAFTWSPDGASFLVSSPYSNFTDIARIEIGTGKNEQLAKSANASTLIWSPDGTQVAFMSTQTIQILDLATKEVRALPITGLQDIQLISWR